MRSSQCNSVARRGRSYSNGEFQADRNRSAKSTGAIDKFAISENILVATSTAPRTNPPTSRNARPSRRVDRPNYIAGDVRTQDYFAIVQHLATRLIPLICRSYYSDDFRSAAKRTAIVTPLSRPTCLVAHDTIQRRRVPLDIHRAGFAPHQSEIHGVALRLLQRAAVALPAVI